MSLRLMSAVIATSVSNSNKVDDSERLLKQLLECVQECQKRYGGKTELATEFDSCVAGLCFSLETVFLHGLRNKPYANVDHSSSTLKQVSDIVAQSLSIGNENLSFWPFVKKHLTKHEQERYAVLKHIWTDTGCGRAWIRSALNERSLERYFHTLLSNSNILKEYYESWAILRDDEKNSMLPNMAAGLGSILFAVSIDKPELNSGITHRPEIFKSKAEPIIQAPVPVETKDKKEKKKRKVARQFISFEDDDSILSTSVPSSSSSTASDSNSIGESNSYKTRSKHSFSQINKDKTNKMNEVDKNTVNEENKHPKVIKKLSIENSGSRDKFSSTIPETLTPIAETGVGELTPVSVELNKNFDSPDISDDILELPTDISAVLTAVEIKNQEEIHKRDEKIVFLAKENESLKEQVKKYVSAIQMLRRDDEGLQKALEGLQIDQQPDYRSEAKIFEKKLVQVAEMHAELMDFNVVLQQTLCQKDALLERLKSELESLRGPMPSDSLNSEEGGNVNVWIPSAFLTGTGSNSHHVYQVYLRAGNDEWNIYRRYAQFYVLHTDLKKLDPVVGTFDFPPKKSIGKKDSALVEDRRKRLQIYLRRVLAHWPELSHCNSRFLLEQHLGFFKDQREDVKNKKNIFSARRPGESSNNYSGL
ncbi:sorting nexin-29 [Anoplophora glabripennis]|nr:sorting nexin-29 [Anoplophora glabripennis]